MSYPKFAKFALPYSRWELPGWGKLLRATGVYDEDRWAGAPKRQIRGKYHGYQMRLDLSEWSERQTYFLGRYYDLQTQLFLRATLRPGETLIDVGGNIGMITLLGSYLVGPQGRVITFEPNPDAARRIRESIEDNAIKNVTLNQVGLADTPGQFTLSVITEHMGMGTLAEPEDEHKDLVSVRHTVDVKRGDDLIADSVPGPAVMKMDIEGFECRALGGLMKTINRLKPAVVTEVSEHHLKRAGASAQQLFDLFHGAGYKGYLLDMRSKALGFGKKLSLVPMDKPKIEEDVDVAWLVPGSVHESRLAKYIHAS